MFSKNIILLFILLLILLIAIIYLNYSKALFADYINKSKNALINMVKRSGIKEINNFTNKENYDANLYLSLDDIRKDPLGYINTVCGGIAFNFNDINIILKENGIEKTAEEILENNKIDIDKLIYPQNSSVPYILMALCQGYSLSDACINNETVSKYSIINYFIKGINILNSLQYLRYPNFVRLSYTEIKDDYITADYITIYYRDYKNKDVPINEAVINDGIEKNCGNGKLCYSELPNTKNLTMTELIKNILPDLLPFKDIIKSLCDLLFAKQLIILYKNDYNIVIPETIINSFNDKMEQLKKMRAGMNFRVRKNYYEIQAYEYIDNIISSLLDANK
jgi:hypothetical protein